MRQVCGNPSDVRASALWGRGGGSDKRSRTRLGKSVALLSVVVLASVLAAGASASSSKTPTAQVPTDLLQAAQAKPNKMFKVIVQGRATAGTGMVASDVRQAGVQVRRKFHVISGVSATLPGKLILRLAKVRDIAAITPDVQVQSTDYQGAEMWRDTADVVPLWTGSPAVACATDPETGLQLDAACVSTPAGLAPQAPAIAIVDSGIDASKVADFGNRVVASVNFSSSSPGATGDGEGHGTMVAGIAAGSSSDYPGVAQNAPLVSVRTSDANGLSYTSDVIAGIDWILQNKDAYNIRVANFSISGGVASSFTVDPLDQAVEKLWFNGVVVVAAAGNQGVAGTSVPMYAPGNDPFVITVGALDQNGDASTANDTIAPWSAYGTTADGFHKPDVSAPGRWMIMPVPADSTIAQAMPGRVVAPGYMWMSGTSFAAPVVSGTAAQLLALHPDWTPDQVKGALMVSARGLDDPNYTGGVGEVDAAAAASVADAPNPNEGLDAYVGADPNTGQPVFDAASWASSVSSDASWASASWTDASWANASWSSASWAAASWSSASWAAASWADAAWTEATASEATWTE